MRVLVTGGAGYIGSVVVDRLVGAGHDVAVIDNLSKGHREAVSPGARLEVVDLEDAPAVARAVAACRPDATVHFAALSLVGESMAAPRRYYRGNLVGTLNLLDALDGTGSRAFVLSSTAAVYGEPTGGLDSPILESHRLAPTNPYGETKLACERLLSWAAPTMGLRAISLRYFNAAGASGILGEDHDPETHLIPNLLRVALGRSPAIARFGCDYPTPDGTAIRDYVHVEDLAAAHVGAVEALLAGHVGHDALNLGTGTGRSVAEVIEAARRVTGHAIPVDDRPRRAGDPPALVASGDLARSVLGWTPRFRAIDEIVASAWEWARAHPDGYTN